MDRHDLKSSFQQDSLLWNTFTDSFLPFEIGQQVETSVFELSTLKRPRLEFFIRFISNRSFQIQKTKAQNLSLLFGPFLFYFELASQLGFICSRK